MKPSFIVRDLRRERGMDLRLFRRILVSFLEGCLQRGIGELAVYLVDTMEMARLNEAFLEHKGPTDVITFDYTQAGEEEPLSGEIFICVPVARAQAKRFRATWQSELIRYAVHGVLHLCGYDDKHAADRARMKQMENRCLKHLAARFDFRKLASGGTQG